MNDKISLFLLLIFTILATGCGPSALTVNLKASSTLNPNEEGQSLPVLVRIYLLRQPQKFLDADFATLWKSDEDALGQDIVKREEITLFPDSDYTLDFERIKKSGATHLAVVGIFRKPDEKCWRQLIEMKTIKSRVTLQLSGQCIEIIHEKKPPPKTFEDEREEGL